MKHPGPQSIARLLEGVQLPPNHCLELERTLTVEEWLTQLMSSPKVRSHKVSGRSFLLSIAVRRNLFGTCERLQHSSDS